jgi:hypothetical protein
MAANNKKSKSKISATDVTDDMLSASVFKDTLSKELEKLKNDILKQLGSEIKSLKSENLNLKGILLKQQIQLENMEKQSRRCNFIVSGIKDSNNSNHDTTVIQKLITTLSQPHKSLNEQDKVPTSESFKHSTRLGSYDVNQPYSRLIKVTMSNSDSAWKIIVNAKDLKKHPEFKGVYISPDDPPLTRKENGRLRQSLKSAKIDNPDSTCYIKRGELFKDNEVIDHFDLRNQLFRS